MNQYRDLTFCIPHYNNPLLLDRCLQSIASITHKCNVIIVDDCSYEENYALAKIIVDRSNFQRVELYRNLSNRGVSFTKNKCFKIADPGWCIFLDCDDYLDRRNGEGMVKFLKSYNGHIAMFHCINDKNLSAHVKVDRTVDIKTYASFGTGGEALTAINKSLVVTPPYYSCLRGYEGLGILSLMKRYSCDIYLSILRPRVYTSDSNIQLSKGPGFKSRLHLIIRGHLHLLKNYSEFLTFKRKVKICLLIILYWNYVILF
jgi:glycosyltransferase involved in cell wall biosynthesis